MVCNAKCTRLKFFYFIIISLLSFSIYALSNLGPKIDLFKVDEIRIVGAKKVEQEAITEKLLVQKGMVLDNYLLQEDIKRIYSMNYFEFVEAHQLTQGNKNILEFKLKERPIISNIKIVGNDQIDKSDIESQIKSKQFNILDTSKIKSDVKDILKFYEEKGYYLANVTYEVKKINEENVDLIFNVSESDKVKVKKIIFLGTRGIDDKTLKDFMLTKEEDSFSMMNDSGAFKDFFFQADLERIKFFYMSKGFLQINIGSPQITVSEDKKWIFITMQVTEGPQFKINSISFSGELLFEEKIIRETLLSKKDDFYSEDLMRKDVNALTEIYQDKGFAFANVLKTIKKVPGENKVDVQFSFEKGDLAYFGKINIIGNSKTRDKVIRRELKIREGVKYSGSALRISKSNVERLGFFEPGSVEFNTTTPKNKRDTLDVEIRVKERNTGQVTLGAGYSSQSSFFFQGSIQQSNFLGKGQILSANLNYSKDNTQVSLNFTEPYFNDSQWLLGGSVFVTNDKSSNSLKEERKGFSLRGGHPLFDYTRAYMTYKLVDTDISGVVSNQLINESLEKGIASSIQFAIESDKRNNRFEPSGGYYIYNSYEIAGLGGTKKWFLMELDSRYYKRVFGDLVFRSRFHAKKLFKVDGEPIPFTQKLYLGGPKDLRGFNIEGVGPQVLIPDLFGNIIRRNARGLFSMYTNFEFEHPLAREAGLKWVVFVDAGNVFSKYPGDGSTNRIRTDYGLGLRWFSPIGIVRLEFGFPIDRRGYEKSKQFYFDLGQIF